MSYPEASIPSSSSSVRVRCSDCGVDSPGHMRFCKQCGTRLFGLELPNQPPDPYSFPVRESDSGDYPAAATSPSLVHARLVTIEQNGSDGQSYELRGEQIDIGREQGEVILSGDPYLSARHARVLRRHDAYYLVDLDSVNGIFLSIRKSTELHHGDTLLIGQQVLRFEEIAEHELGPACAYDRGVRVFGTPAVCKTARLVQYSTEGIGRDLYVLYRHETVLGRETGDIVFTDDPFLSRRHAAITMDRSARRFSLHDLGSSNGTGLRLREDHRLESGDQFRLGRHLFRFDIDDIVLRGSGGA